MLLFCPSCSNMLTVEKAPAHQLSREDRDKAEQHRLVCRTCPYQHFLAERYYERKFMETRAVEDIMGGSESWANVDRTEARCPNERCDSIQAFFRQVQIRSADEPMTSFYRCCECQAEWREN